MEKMDEIEIAIRLSRYKGVGASGFKKLIDEYHLPSIANKIWLEKMSGRKLSKISLIKNSSEELINNSIRYIRENKCIAYYYGESGYPQQLMSLTEPPPVVFMSSDLKKMPFAAVVGSRIADESLLNKARFYTRKLIAEGYGIVSGGASGVDRIAHQTALAENAYTVAVIANGLDVVYPLSHKDLFERIKEKGVLLTELMIGAEPHKSFFPTRNRLIAAMADIVVALPSTNSNGTLITVNWAKKLGKKLICE